MIKEKNLERLKLRELVTRICDDCGKEEKIRYARIRYSEIEKDFSRDYCKKCSYKHRKVNEHCRGSKSVDWKGGMAITKNGYLRYTSGWDENGEKRDRKGEYVHKVLYGKALGRKLTKIEQLHHIDMNKLNNEINNLFLCENKSKHYVLHAQMEEVALTLLNKYIWFDKENKIYTTEKKEYPIICFIVNGIKPSCRRLDNNGKYYECVYVAYRKHEAYHRYIMEKFLNKKLLRYEQVHHIDGNTLNNDINNLIVVTRNDHKNIHFSLQECIKKLFEQKIVVFNNGKYEICQNI